MKPCWAAMAAFERPVTAPFDGAFVNVGPLSWVARDSSKPGRDGTLDRWVLHAGPDWSATHLEDDRDVVGAALVEAFFRAVGLEPHAPIWLQAHRWRYALAENPLEVGCLVDSSNQIVACGDWTSGNRVEGAILSGLSAARAIQETRRSGGR
jgi:predicted NAD/FAD-dependent oxidoreductase